MAGRAMIKDLHGRFVQKLIKIEQPSTTFNSFSCYIVNLNVDLVLRVPSLAVHLDRQETFTFNKETQLFPIAGLVAADLNRQGNGDDKTKAETTNGGDSSSTRFSPLKAPDERHHPHIIKLIADEVQAAASEIVDFEMVLYDTQKSCVGGLNKELLFSPRLDNLEMSFCSTVGLINSVNSSSSLDDEESIRLIALFDHEEIGSNTGEVSTPPWPMPESTDMLFDSSRRRFKLSSSRHKAPFWSSGI